MFVRPLSVFIICVLCSTGVCAQGFQWARKIGGTEADYGNAIAVDSRGDVYIAGMFQGTADFDPGPAVVNLTPVGDIDIFVAKFDSSGNLLWAKALGGGSDDRGEAITLDALGNVYIAGFFNAYADFDPGPASFVLTSSSGNAAFVCKLSNAGDFVWARSFTGAGFASAHAVKIDGLGNVYTTGVFGGTTDFDPGAGVMDLTPVPGACSAFISRLDKDGNFNWARQIDGSPGAEGYDLAVDDFGYLYTVGFFKGILDVDPGPAILNIASAGELDVFISRWDTAGNFLWAKTIGGLRDDIGSEVAVDKKGGVYLTGSFGDTVDFDPGPVVHQLTSPLYYQGFLLRLDSSGSFTWAKSLGGNFGHAIVAGNDDIFLADEFGSLAPVDFDPGPDTFMLRSRGGSDVCISRFTATGSFVSAVSFGGGSFDQANAIALDGYGSVYTIGNFSSPCDFDPGTGDYTLGSSGLADAFIHKMSYSPLGVGDSKLLRNSRSIYPNPTTGQLFIEGTSSGEVNVLIMDVLGRNVFASQFRGGTAVSMDISHIPAGVFLLRIQDGNGQQVFRLVRE